MLAPDAKAGIMSASTASATSENPLGPCGGDTGRFREWLDAHGDDLEALVLDVDGVLLLANQATAGSHELLARLRSEKRPFVLLTNDADHSPQEKAHILRTCGLDIQAEQIVSCGHGLADVTAEYQLREECFFILGDLGNPCYAKAAGLKTTRRPSDLPSCRGVIVGENHYDWEPNLNAVVNYFIRRPKALLISPNPDEYYPDGRGNIRLAAGSVSRLIQRALTIYGRPKAPLYLGKPYEPIFQTAHQRLEKIAGGSLAKNRVLMIGDNLDADIAGASAFGYRTAIVLTGLTTLEMLADAPSKPDWVWCGL
jgi:HAD superfamily hydrolase (TIGR01450 family)